MTLEESLIQFTADTKAICNPRVILDVGAHDNFSARFLKEQFPAARVLAFEPDPVNFLTCQQNARNIELYNLALGDSEGFATFYHTPGNLGACSLLKPDFVPWAHDQRVLEEKVKVTTLDKFCDENGVIPDVAWVDVQGAEYDLIRGGLKAFSKMRAIYMEVAESPYYAGGKHRDETVALLETLGFRILRDERDWERESNLTLIRD